MAPLRWACRSSSVSKVSKMPKVFSLTRNAYQVLRARLGEHYLAASVEEVPNFLFLPGLGLDQCQQRQISVPRLTS